MLLALLLFVVAAGTQIPSPTPAPTPLPFTPPAGWTMMPRAYTDIGANATFVGPKTSKGQEAITAIKLPTPLSVDAIARTMSGKKRPVNFVSGSRLTVCGAKAYLATARALRGSLLSESLFTAKSGAMEVLTYVRPVSMKSNPAIESVLRRYCGGPIAASSLPAGWTRKAQDYQVAGVWLGPEVMHIVTLMRVNGLPSPQTMIDQFTRISSNSAASSVLHVKTVARTTLCGNPGFRATIELQNKSLPMTVQAEATALKSNGYMLLYTRPSSQKDDAAAIASLKSLCASPNPSNPVPSAPPTLVPQPSPTPQPSLSPTPVPSPAPTSGSPIAFLEIHARQRIGPVFCNIEEAVGGNRARGSIKAEDSIGLRALTRNGELRNASAWSDARYLVRVYFRKPHISVGRA